MNNGKKLEKFVRLIQETLKDVPGTQIFSNYKIDNRSGRKREIDVLIKSSISNIEIIIAIECKDYKKSVPVEKIEAFNSKCQRIKGISKKIFVASNGYQADSFEAALDFDIELYNLNEISSLDITEWFSIKQLRAQYRLKPPHGIKMVAEKNEIEKLPYKEELIIHFFEDKQPISLTAYLWNYFVYENQRKLKSFLLYDFMKYNGNLNYQTIIPFKLDVSGIYVNGDDDKKFEITTIESSVVGWLEETPINIIEGRSYNKIGSGSQANIVSINVDENEVADFVFTEENDLKIFHTNPDGQVREMMTLFEYNPKTDEFIKKYNENGG